MEFTEFVDDERRGLLHFAGALTGNPATAEDVVQEVLIKLHRHWSRVSGLDAPLAYARRAVLNEYLSWRRKWSRQVPVADVPDHADGAADQHPEHLAQRSELAAGLAALPQQQRVVLVLRYYLDLSDSDIARQLGCREATVRGYAARGLRTLRVDVTASRSTHAH